MAVIITEIESEISLEHPTVARRPASKAIGKTKTSATHLHPNLLNELSTKNLKSIGDVCKRLVIISSKSPLSSMGSYGLIIIMFSDIFVEGNLWESCLSRMVYCVKFIFGN